jgi:hypothetical protein
VQDNFEFIIIAIVVISLIPTLVGIIKMRLARRGGGADRASGADTAPAQDADAHPSPPQDPGQDAPPSPPQDPPPPPSL